MTRKHIVKIYEGEPSSPFLLASRKWNPVTVDIVPQKISEHEYKRNIEEMGRFLYKHIESQVQRPKKVPSSETESKGSKDPRKDKVV